MQVKPIFEENKELLENMNKLYNKYPDKFLGIKIEEIMAVSIVNKERSDKKSILWQINSVSYPAKLHNPYGWYVIVHKSDWDALTERTKVFLAMQILHGISPEEGKVNPFNYKDFGPMVRTFGADYLAKADLLPDLLQDSIDWKEEETLVTIKQSDNQDSQDNQEN